MVEYNLSTPAYCKMILHALKYPHCAVNGVLIAEKRKGDRSSAILICDAVPLFHLSLQLTPMLEVALAQIEQTCQQQQLQLIGYYQANERYREINPNPVAFKICEKLQSTVTQDAILLTLDNTRMSEEQSNGHVFRTFYQHEQKWKPLESERISMDNDETARTVLSACIQKKLYRELVDFDNHLDQPSLDYWNSKLTEKIVVSV